MLKHSDKVHFVGVKGVGMTALAQVLKKHGVLVSGSDTKEKFFTDQVLKKEKIPVKEFFSAENLAAGLTAVIYSTAYQSNNPEIAEAKKRKIPLYTYPEALALLLKDKFSIAVAGSHGKTTATALLGYIIEKAGKDPTVIVGSRVPQFSGNARVGRGKYFIFEADEYQNKFTLYTPTAAVILNVDFDHPDFFKNKKEYQNAFKRLAQKIPKKGFLVAWGDDKETVGAVRGVKAPVIKFGLGKSAFKAAPAPDGQFYIWANGKNQGMFTTKLPGAHNILNILACAAAARQLKISWPVIRKAVASFRGSTRRFEILGRKNGVTIVDDYAHHPTEIKALLQTARTKFPNNKLTAIFHPHTFTRTRTFLKEFAESLAGFDEIIVIDIYGSAREKHGGVHSRDLVKKINELTQPQGMPDEEGNALYLPTKEKVLVHLKKWAEKGEVIFTIGAGDVWKVGKWFLGG